MFPMGLLGLIFGIKKSYDEMSVKPIPKEAWFDNDAYWSDIRNDVPAQVRDRKIANGEYWTTRPKPKDWWELPFRTIVDVERYEHDKEKYGKEYAEMKRSWGDYRQKKPIE